MMGSLWNTMMGSRIICKQNAFLLRLGPVCVSSALQEVVRCVDFFGRSGLLDMCGTHQDFSDRLSFRCESATGRRPSDRLQTREKKYLKCSIFSFRQPINAGRERRLLPARIGMQRWTLVLVSNAPKCRRNNSLLSNSGFYPSYYNHPPGSRQTAIIALLRAQNASITFLLCHPG